MGFLGSVGSFIGNAKNTATGFIDGAKKKVSEAVQTVEKAPGEVVSFAQDGYDTASKQVGEWAGDAGNAAVAVGNGALDAAQTAVKVATYPEMVLLGTGILVTEGTINAVKAGIDAAGKLPGEASDAVAKAYGAAHHWSDDQVKAFKAGYESTQKHPAQRAAHGGLVNAPGAISRPAPADVTPAAPSRPTVQQGSTGENVSELQKLLVANKFDPQGIDGIFGPLTNKAVEAFQTSKGLDATGVVDGATWSALQPEAMRADLARQRSATLSAR